MSSMSEGAQVADLISICSVWQINVDQHWSESPNGCFLSCVTSVEHIESQLIASLLVNKNKLLHLSKNCFAGIRLNAFSTFLEFAAVNGLDILTLTSISRCFYIWQRNDNLITYAAKCMSA